MEDKYCEYEKLDQKFEELTEVIFDNRQYFASGRKAIHSNFFDTFQRILNVLEPLKFTLEDLRDVCAEYDVAEDIKGNGFRSLICITEKCMKKIHEIAIYIQKNRDRFFFRSYHFYMELEAYAQVISRLFTVIQLSLSARTILQNGSLFPDEDRYSEEMNGLMDDFETIGRECFYGRSFGFQFSGSLQQSLQVVAIAMAAYGDGFKLHNGSTARALSSVLHSGKYVVDPELRAKRIVELTQHVSMSFCKAFWSITENHGIQHVPMLICPNLAVNKEIYIDVLPLNIPTANGFKTIYPYFASSKPKRILTRLLSYSYREGQGKSGSTDSLAEALGRRTHGLSKNLVLHCHGGGFVAQSSKSHEIYLRSWAKELDCPVLSIDYSLAPESPYPEALNECLYVYAWVLLNHRCLGSSIDRICLTGDSAGANLMVAVTLKAIDAGIRLPDGLAIAYPPLRVQYTPSPSRILSLMDPLLPPGILKVCLRAYAGTNNAENLPEDTGSCKSLRSFEHSYNPFDVDLGDGAMHAGRVNWVSVTGKRSYSDSNLIATGRSLNFRRKDSIISNSSCRESLITEDEEAEGLHMHPISQNGAKVRQDCLNRETVCGERVSDASAVSRVDKIKETSHAALINHENSADGESSRKANEKDSFADNHRENGIVTYRMHKNKSKNSRAKTFSHHRRSLSDSLAESFNRLRPKSAEFSESFFEETNECYLVHEKELNGKASKKSLSPPGSSESGNQEKQSINLAAKREYSARYIKNGEGCLIIGEENKEISVTYSTSDFDDQTGDINGGTEKSSSCDSITSSIKRRSKDPFMSPLLASDELLLQMPQLLTVACTLDPLLDDSVEFTRRLLKLGKRAEIFIVDDLPHGFLNFNFASSEAKDASDLLVACIKRILTIGVKHENSFPVSPGIISENPFIISEKSL